MKKTLKLLVVITSFVSFFKTANADCSYSERAILNREVANIKVRYEAKKGIDNDPQAYVCGEEDENGNCLTEGVEYDYFDMNILNLSDKFYANVKQDRNYSSKDYYQSDADEDGVIHFEWDEVDEITKFTITIYTTEQTNCKNEKMRVIYVTLPRKNVFSDLDICAKVPDYYKCSSFVNYENDGDIFEFISDVEKEIESRAEKEQPDKLNFWEKLWNFIKDNKVEIIVGISVIVVIASGSVYIIRKRRSL